MVEDGTMEKEHEVKGMVRMLKAIADAAEHASLTGALKNGAPSAQQSYNKILQRLGSLNLVSKELFAPIEQTSNLDEIGLAATQLAAFLTGAFDLDRRAGISNLEEFSNEVLKSVLGEMNAKKKAEKAEE
jgi:hypothetical protein